MRECSRSKAIKIMGARILFRLMTNAKLQAHIRLLAKDSSLVFFTRHAQDRMKERFVSDIQVLECLRSGQIQRPSQFDQVTGSVKCRMEHFVAGMNVAVVVAVEYPAPDLTVVTVIDIKKG